MKNIFKHFIYTVIATCMLTIPAMAGQVELQTEVPFYTVREGVELTEEEQRAINATIEYFIAHPEVTTVELNSNEFPNLSVSWYNSIATKLNIITENYPIINEDGWFVYRNYLTYAVSTTNKGDCLVVTVENYLIEAIGIKQWVEYCYALVPSLGIENGMDELTAIEIINNFVCDHMETDGAYTNRYIELFATKRGTCGDYALLFKALARGAGIEAYTLSSITECHGWNEVVIDGQAYEIDTCWNDKPYWNRHYIYMLTRSQTATFKHHKYVEYRE